MTGSKVNDGVTPNLNEVFATGSKEKGLLDFGRPPLNSYDFVDSLALDELVLPNVNDSLLGRVIDGLVVPKKEAPTEVKDSGDSTLQLSMISP